MAQVPDMAARPDERAARLRAALTKRGDRFGLLLLLLVFSYLLSAFTSGDTTTVFQTLLFVVTMLLALRTSRVRRQSAQLIIAATVAGSAAIIALGLGHATARDTAVGIANIWTGLILLVTVGVILRRVLEMPTVSLQSIFGAVSAYMIIGLMFASFYAAMSHLDPAPFFSNGSPGNTRTFQYFSFTTLTTLGYGDFTAAGNAGRAVAVMEALGGQIFLATLVARLVASYRAPQRNGGAPPADRGNGSDGGAGDRPGGPAAGGSGRAGASRQEVHLPGQGNGPRHATRQAPVKWRNRRR